MQSVLQGLQRELGITFVYVTHSQSEAFSMADRVVIMSKGVVEQIGTAQEIYRAPKTRFVAEFLGSSNILSGKSDGNGMLETAVGKFHSPQNRERQQKGSSTTMVVLDTRSHLSVDEPGSEFDFVCTKVVGEEFAGATATIYLEAEDGSEFRVQKNHDKLEALQIEVGQPLYVSWRPNETHLISDA